MPKRELLSRLIHRAGLLSLMGKLAPSSVTVLAYHSIRQDRVSQYYEFDAEVLGPKQTCFERQMSWLKRHLTVLSEEELLEQVRTKSEKRHHYAVVTFDDGYRDNYDLAYPVLKALSLPAIFFVCPKVLDERRLGWWDLIAYAVKYSAKAGIEMRGETLPFGEQKLSTISKLHTWMKSLPAAETESLVQSLFEAAEVEPPGLRIQSDRLMTWEQVAEVRKNGIAIGSHTQTHRVLATLDEEQQRWELRQSKAALEARLGARVRTVAYPAGRYGNFTAATMRLARECGYEAAFSFHSGGNRFPVLELYDVHRIAASDQLSPMFACAAMLPDVFTWRTASN
jgi:peptidoglycan/xylan/chitin deacetylase (PgdA/CDA1 family)